MLLWGAAEGMEYRYLTTHRVGKDLRSTVHSNTAGVVILSWAFESSPISPIHRHHPIQASSSCSNLGRRTFHRFVALESQSWQGGHDFRLRSFDEELSQRLANHQAIGSDRSFATQVFIT